MRQAVKNTVRHINRATKLLGCCESTTIAETIALIKAVAELRAMVMLVGDRARRAQQRENDVQGVEN